MNLKIHVNSFMLIAPKRVHRSLLPINLFNFIDHFLSINNCPYVICVFHGIYCTARKTHI